MFIDLLYIHNMHLLIIVQESHEICLFPFPDWYHNTRLHIFCGSPIPQFTCTHIFLGGTKTLGKETCSLVLPSWKLTWQWKKHQFYQEIHLLKGWECSFSAETWISGLCVEPQNKDDGGKLAEKRHHCGQSYRWKNRWGIRGRFPWVVFCFT